MLCGVYDLLLFCLCCVWVRFLVYVFVWSLVMFCALFYGACLLFAVVGVWLFGCVCVCDLNVCVCLWLIVC